MKTITKIKWLQRLGIFNLAREVLYKLNPHYADMITLYRQFIAVGDICFDIGANIGQKTDIFLKLGARVIAVEPQEECVRYLRRKYRDDSRVTVISMAVADQTGQREFFICNADSLSTMSTEWIEATTKSGHFSDFAWDKKTIVETTTLTALAAEYGQPKFIKVDVEGGEFDVVKGLTRPVPFMSLEITDESVAAIKRCICHLDTLGRATFNHCSWDRSAMTFQNWISKEKILKEIDLLVPGKLTGDLYIRFQ